MLRTPCCIATNSHTSTSRAIACGPARRSVMKRLTYALVGAGAVLATDTSTAITTCTTVDCGPPPVAIHCDGAALSLGVIWPPNHTMVAENVVGAYSDAGDGSVTI